MQVAVQEASKGNEETWANESDSKGVKYAIQWGRKLDYNHWDMWRMVSPLCLWAALLIVCYGVAYWLLKASIPSVSNIAANGRVLSLGRMLPAACVQPVAVCLQAGEITSSSGHSPAH